MDSEVDTSFVKNNRQLNQKLNKIGKSIQDIKELLAITAGKPKE